MTIARLPWSICCGLRAKPLLKIAVLFKLNQKRRKFIFVIAFVAVSTALLSSLFNIFTGVHYRLEIAYDEFKQTEVEKNACADGSPSCRSLEERLNDAWLGFNAGRNRNPLILYKKYRDYLRWYLLKQLKFWLANRFIFQSSLSCSVRCARLSRWLVGGCCGTTRLRLGRRCRRRVEALPSASAVISRSSRLVAGEPLLPR